MTDLPGITELMAELWILTAGIWATTQMVGPALPKINNRVIALVLGVAYALGAHFSGYLQGGLFVVLGIKVPVACIAAQLFHERIYSSVKSFIAGRGASSGVPGELKPSVQEVLGAGPEEKPTQPPQ